MTTYISLLRAINVSGHRPLKMDSLRKLFESLNFEKVQTYLQSGNVVFTSKEEKNEIIVQKISKQIKKEFGYEVSVIAFPAGRLKEVVDNNPFSNNADTDPKFFHITFLSSRPDLADWEAIQAKKQEGEKIIFKTGVIYLYCPHGYGRTKLTNSFLEKKLKVAATTRNWKTTSKLLELATQIS